jgi:hypothetical protein
MRKLTQYLIILVAAPLILGGVLYEFSREAFSSGITLCDRGMENLSDWING